MTNPPSGFNPQPAPSPAEGVIEPMGLVTSILFQSAAGAVAG